MSARRRCPICGTELERGVEAARHAAPGGGSARVPWPFCSERCRVIDLGRWLGESYRLPDRPGGDELRGLPDTGPGGAHDGDDELLH